MLIRAQEVARYVSDGVLTPGSPSRTGSPSTGRRGDRGRPTCDLVYASRLRQGEVGAGGAGGLAVSHHEGSRRQDDCDRAGRATRLLRQRVNVKVEFSWGATRSSRRCSPTRSSGDERSSLGRTGCILNIMESNTQLIANYTVLADPGAHQAREHRAALKAAIEAQGRVGLMLGARRADLAAVWPPPGAAAPTIWR